MANHDDLRALAQQLAADASPEEGRALLEALMSGQVSSILDRVRRDEVPTLLPVPAEVCGVRVRLDLRDAQPPVWRRLELPGDLLLPRLHDVIQAAMGWTDSHLHRFRTARDHRSPHFVTPFDVDEDEEGTPEGDVRLDQLLAQPGDELWYEYDFGDGWEHRLLVEKVLDEAPERARCTAGRMACPPEDCGGIWGYQELAAWVRSGYDDAQLPGNFDNAADARDWLPPDWHPEHFDPDETDAEIAAVVAEPVAVIGELAELVAQTEQRGVRLLREAVSRPASHGPVEVTDADAARLTEAYSVLLDAIGDGVALTAAGYLPPAVVERIAERTGITGWWIGKANREDLTPPVAALRASARALGLVTVRKGRLSPTAAAVRAKRDPQALLRHIVGRLPLGTTDAERQSGWMALVAAGSGVPAEAWRDEVSDLLAALGWRSGSDRFAPPPARSATLDVLDHLAGAARVRWRKIKGVDAAVAAAARAAYRTT